MHRSDVLKLCLWTSLRPPSATLLCASPHPARDPRLARVDRPRMPLSCRRPSRWGRTVRLSLVHHAAYGWAAQPPTAVRLFVVVALLGGLSPLEPPVDLVRFRVPPFAHPVLEAR